ncbi:hypothetical protein K0U00_32560, partial [Paenibacillus sepulcri]|nr:hypothetical protein [Paenibacillus sepulcri]
TTVLAGTAEGDAHGAAAAVSGDNAAVPSDSDSSTDAVTLWLAIAALAVSVIALIFVLARRRKA